MPDFSKPPEFSKPSPFEGQAPAWTAPKPAPRPAVVIDKGVALEPPKPKAVEAPTPSRRLVMHPPPGAGFKPNTDMLVAVVRNYLRAMSPTAMPDQRLKDEWEAAAEHNKLQLEQELIQIGLRDAIDFER